MQLSIFLFVVSVTSLEAYRMISVYGDVYKDVDFFTRTFPWIIDNIGGDLTIDYHLLGSGRYSIPQMCALNELKQNTFLQAQYLQCEAEGTDSEYCLCNVGIDPEKFEHCVQSGGYLASDASSKYSQLGIDASPVVEIAPSNTIFEVGDTWYLKKICTIFGEDMPRGCVKPFACNQTDVAYGKRGVACFDCKHQSECDRRTNGVDKVVTLSTTPTPTATYQYYLEN